uniref:Uncharacterized protein n=1 Tax=Pyrodinium bahamense TaxID=73915 RepID=A0A7S0AMR7_9DINO
MAGCDVSLAATCNDQGLCAELVDASAATTAGALGAHTNEVLSTIAVEAPDCGTPSPVREAALLRPVWHQVFLLMAWQLLFVVSAVAGLTLCRLVVQRRINVPIGVFALAVNAGFLMFKTVFKNMGMALDWGKLHTQFPMYWVSELTNSFLYFQVYQSLLEGLHDWWSFFSLQAVHLAMEWNHCLRASKAYYMLTQKVLGSRGVSRRPWLHRKLLGALLVASPGITARDWACCIAVDHGLRVLTAYTSLLVWVPGCVWLRSGYNARLYPALPGWDLHLFAAQSAMMLVLETLNSLAIEWYFRVRLGPGGSLRRVGGIMRNWRIASSFIGIATLGCTDGLWQVFKTNHLCIRCEGPHVLL